MEALDSTAVARMGLILGHLLAFALAAVGIALEIDPAHREAFNRMTARKLRGDLAEAA